MPPITQMVVTRIGLCPTGDDVMKIAADALSNHLPEDSKLERSPQRIVV